MERKIDKSRLGVDPEVLKRASIQFVQTDIPQIDHMNSYVMEGFDNTFKTIHEDTNTYRPFLIIENKELHCLMAIYMTTSISRERMEVDNRIRGEHLYETPFGLANYLSNSAIKGTVAGEKISVIDRDRVIFLTEDALINMDRAKDIDEFEISLYRHAQNARSIEDLLKKDLASQNFTQMVKNAKPELWTFRKGAGRPIIYHPTANYLSLFINNFFSFTNSKYELNVDELTKLSEVSKTAVMAYYNHIKFIEKLKQLQVGNEAMFEALQNTRYYNNMITPSTYKEMEKNYAREFISNGSVNGFESYYPNQWRNIYGDAGTFKKIPLDDRIRYEMERCYKKWNRPLSKEDIAFAESKFKELMQEETQVNNALGKASDSVIKFMADVNSSFRFNLSSVPYNTNFWQDYFRLCDNLEYEGQLENLVQARANKLINIHKKHDELKKNVKYLEQLKEALAKQQAIEEQAYLEKCRKELYKVIKNRYYPLYLKPYKVYKQGKLLPVTSTEIDNYSKLLSGAGTEPKKLVLGNSLYNALAHENENLKSLTDLVEYGRNTLLTSEKHLTELIGHEKSKKLMGLMDKIFDVDEQVVRNSKGKSAREISAQSLVALKDMVYSLSDSELKSLAEDDFDFGRRNEAMLCYMQDIFNSRSQLRGLSAVKNNRNNIMSAIEKLNDNELLNSYKESVEVVESLANGKTQLPVGVVAPSIDALNQEIEKIQKSLNQNCSQSQYDAVIKFLNSKQSEMKRFCDWSKELVQKRDSLQNKLLSYEEARQNTRNRIRVNMKNAVQEAINNEKEAVMVPFTIYSKHSDGRYYVGPEELRLDENGYTKKELGEKFMQQFDYRDNKFYRKNDPDYIYGITFKDLSNVINSLYEEHEDGKLYKRGRQKGYSESEFKETIDDTMGLYKDCLDRHKIVDLDKDLDIALDLYDKTFPPKEQIYENIQKRISQCKTVQEASTRYGEIEQQLDKLLSERPFFMSNLIEEYVSIATKNTELIQSAIEWRELSDKIAESAYNELTEDIKASKKYSVQIEAGVSEAVDILCDNIVDQVSEYRNCVRARTAEIVDALEPRVLGTPEIQTYLTKSVLKAQRQMSADMPKAIMGANGVSEMVSNVADEKLIHVGILDKMLHGNADDVSKVDCEKISNTVSKAIDVLLTDKYIQAKKTDIECMKLELLEGLRRVGLEDPTFINDPNALEKMMRHFKSCKKPLLIPARLDNCRMDGNRSRTEGIDYFNAATAVLEKLSDLRARVKSKNSEPYTTDLILLEGHEDEEPNKDNTLIMGLAYALYDKYVRVQGKVVQTKMVGKLPIDWGSIDGIISPEDVKKMIKEDEHNV